VRIFEGDAHRERKIAGKRGNADNGERVVRSREKTEKENPQMKRPLR